MTETLNWKAIFIANHFEYFISYHWWRKVVWCQIKNMYEIATLYYHVILLPDDSKCMMASVVEGKQS